MPPAHIRVLRWTPPLQDRLQVDQSLHEVLQTNKNLGPKLRHIYCLQFSTQIPQTGAELIIQDRVSF